MASGSNVRPLLQRDIIVAQSFTKSGAEAARYLNVTYSTYKKYAKLYGLFEQHSNRTGKGIPRKKRKGQFGIDSILEGKHPNYPRTKLKERLIRAGYLVEACGLCGFNKKREWDGRCPLTLQFKDADPHNFSLDNLQLRCLNCTYLTTGTVSPNEVLTPGAQDVDVLAQLSLDEIHALQSEMLDSVEQDRGT